MKKLLSVILAVIVVAMSVPVVQISAEGAEDYTYETDDGWAAEEHTHNEMYLEERAPTCTEDGWTAEVICADCGVVLREKEIIPAFGHNFEGGVCSYCGESNGESEGHTHNEVIRPGYAPTCTTEGLTDTVFCADCGVIISDAQILPSLGHYFVDSVCQRCGERDASHIHMEEIIPQVDPTCTESGWTEWIICHECGEQLTHSSEIAPLGHSYVDGYCERCYEEEPSGSEDFTYEIIDGNVTITGAYSATLSITVPEYIEGCPVTAIGNNAFYGFEGTYEVNLPSSITSIGDYAFAHTSVQHMVLPESLTNLGEGAFYSCSNLMSVVIPEGVQFIMPGTFEGCGYLSEVTLSNGLIAIHRNAFTKCYSLVSIDIPYTISKIDGQAFSECYDLREVNIAEGNDIYYSAGSAIMMYNDGRLVVGIGGQPIPDDGSVKIVGSGSYYKSYLSRSLVIPDGVQYIDAYAFFECGNVFELTLPESIIRIGDSAFAGTSVRTVYYNGTREQWESVEIGYDNDVFAEAEVIFADGSTTGCAHENVFILGGYAPTCTEYGVTEGLMCNDCGKVVQYQDSIPPLGHSYVDGYCERCGEAGGEGEEHIHNEMYLEERAPTCTADGWTAEVICADCGVVLREKEIIPAFGHNFDGGVCSYCGESNGESEEHTHNEVIRPGYAPTCTTEGLTDTVFCADCGVIISDAQILPSLGHYFVDSVCQRCGERDASHIHMEEIIPQVDPTCTESGWTEWIICHECGEQLTHSSEIAPLGHSYVDGYCERCGEQESGVCEHIETIIPGREPTCTESGMTEGVCCSVCGELLSAPMEIPPLGHEETVTPMQAPTCTMDGWTDSVFCFVCYTYLIYPDVIPATGHNEVVLPDLMPTCTEDGMTGGVQCDTCGEILVYPAVIGALGHDFVDGYCQVCGENESGGEAHIHTEVYLPSVEPTCTENGWTDGIVCGECGFVIVEQTILPAYGHSEELIGGYEPTCTESGMMDFLKCYNCGEMLSEIMEIPPLGHEFVDGYCTRCGEQKGEEECNHVETIIPGKAPTCTEEGLSEGLFCSLCGLVFWEQQIVPPEGHCEEWVYGWEATCTESGMTEAVRCYVCGEYTSDPPTEIAPLGHIEQISYGWEPSCWDDGMTDGIYCERCGEWLVEQTIITSTGHSFQYFEGVEPTCTEDGYTSYSRCSVCGFEETSQTFLPAYGHDEVWTYGYDATCTMEGLTEGCYCERCGETIVEQYVTPMLPHTEIWEGGWEPTCTEPGRTEGCYCSMCGEVLLTAYDIPAKGHTEEIVPMVPPTCTEEGLSDGKYCSVCYETLVIQEIIPALGHQEEWLYGHEATCTEEGLTDGKWCVNCGETTQWQEYTPPLGHEFVDGYCTRCGEQDSSGHVHEIEIMPGVAPTCTDYGSTEGQRCLTCGEVLVRQEYIEPIGHNFVDGACTNCGVLDSDSTDVSYEIVDGGAIITDSNYDAKEIIVPDMLGGYPVVAVGTYSFSNRMNLINVVLPETVTVIWDYAFSFSEINTIYLPKSLTTIAEGAFSDCLSLKTVYFSGTAEEFAQIQIGTNNDALLKAEIVYMGGGDEPHVHTEAILEGYRPTCTEDGMTEGIICYECGEIIISQAVIPAMGHREEIIPSVAPTCVDSGLTDGIICSVCGEILAEQAYIEALGHEIVNGACTRCDYTEVEVPVVDYVVEGVLTNGGKQLDVTISVKGNIYNIWSSIMYLDFNKNALAPIVDSFEIGDTWGSINCVTDVSVIPVSSQFEWARNCVYVEFVSNDVEKGMPYSDGVIVKLSFEVLNAEEDFNLNYALWSDKAEYEPVASNHLVLIDGEPVVADVNVIYSIEEDYTHTHTEVIVPGYAPTCTEPGLTDGISCEECGEVILEQTAIALVNHNYVDGKCSYCGLVLDTEKFLLNVTSEMIDGKLYVYYDINNNPGIWSIMADLSFNAEALELVGIYNGVVFIGDSYSESPVTDGTHRYFAALESVENCYENGRLVTYVFDILDSTKSFDIAVTIDPENVFNCDFENQEITIVNEANKEIETPDEPEVSIGDINGDNSVNTQDLFRVKLIMQTIVEPTDAERAAADVNGDGLVNAADIFALSYRILYGEWV